MELTRILLLCAFAIGITAFFPPKQGMRNVDDAKNSVKCPIPNSSDQPSFCLGYLHILNTLMWTLYIIHKNVICPDYNSHFVSDYFFCANGDVILEYNYCDGTAHCVDGSDEIIATQNEVYNQETRTVKCNNFRNPFNGSCVLPQSQLCSNKLNCTGVTPCDGLCKDYYICQDGSCMARDTICNKTSCNGCFEDDAKILGPGFKCKRFGNDCILPQQLLYDVISDCDGGVDRCYKRVTAEKGRFSYDIRDEANFLFDHAKCFECFNKQMIIPRSCVCDGVFDCFDLSDECLCALEVPSICRSLNRNSQASNENTPIYSPWQCNYGDVRCMSGYCVRRESVCDGVIDCPDEEDESFEFCRGTLPCMQTQLAKRGDICSCSENYCYHKLGVLCDDVQECGWLEDECNDVCAARSCTSPQTNNAKWETDAISYIFCTSTYPINLYAQWSNSTKSFVSAINYGICDGILHCDVGWEDEGDFCPDTIPCVTATMGRVRVSTSETCDGVPHCSDASDEAQSRCNKTRFFCSAFGGRQISIDKGLVCDFSIACDDAEDELNCDDDRFYCEDGELPVFVKASQLLDGRQDCADWSDECPSNETLRTENILSSRYDLIASPILQVLVWVMAIFSIIGNFVVIKSEAANLRRMRNRCGSLFANHCCILNLALADFLMGVYLLAIIAMSLKFRGNYCSQELGWRSSVGCTSLGILATIATETSVLSLLLLTMLRLISIFRPIESMSSPGPRLLVLALTITWSIPIILAFLPLSPNLSHIFLDRVMMKESPFIKGNTVTLFEYKTIVKEFALFENMGLNISNSDYEKINTMQWEELESFSKKNYNNYRFLKPEYFGYYSTHGVCLPKLFTYKTDKAWVFSFCVNLFNFISFLVVLISYIVIYTKTTTVPSHLRNEDYKAKAKKNQAIQRKIFRLILTDFICWVPICIFSFVRLAGVDFSNGFYAFSAIILLPINSALNPILYSNLLDNMFKRCFPKPKATSLQTTMTAAPSS